MCNSSLQFQRIDVSHYLGILMSLVSTVLSKKETMSGIYRASSGSLLKVASWFRLIAHATINP